MATPWHRIFGMALAQYFSGTAWQVDVEVALDMIYGPLFYRLLVGHKPLNAEFTDALLTQAVAGLERRKGR